MRAHDTSPASERRHPWRLAALALLTIGLLMTMAFQLGRRSPLLTGATTEVRAENGKAANAAGMTQAEGDATFTPAALTKAGIEVQTVRETARSAHLPVTGTVEPNLQGMVKITARV